MGRGRDLSRSDPDAVTAALRGGGPGETVAEHHALGKLRARLFGRGHAPITLARYVLLERLGSGGAGVVFEAHDPELDRKVAIKLLRPRAEGGVDESEARARLLREAQSLAKLSHPNVVSVYDVGSYREDELALPEGDRMARGPTHGVFMVMELVEGETLRRWIDARRWPWQKVLEVFLAAGRGLAAAHAHGLVHRDFKPENVAFGSDGRVRVLDFGLARALSEHTVRSQPAPVDATQPAGAAVSITRTGTIMGTPAYMAPEQHQGDALDARSDQFSFCVALYEALYGVRPFAGDADGLARAKRRGDITPPPSDVDVPERIRRALLHGLETDPAERFPTMDALLAELGRDPARRRRRLVGAGLGVASLAAAVTFGAIAWSQHRTGACLGQDRLLVGVWDDDVRAAARGALLATGKPYAEQTWATVERALDRYAGEWVAARTETCEATLVRREVPRAHMDAAILCLDGRLKALGEVTAMLASADADVAQGAVAAVSRLQHVDGCGGEAGRRVERLDREVVLELEGGLARAESQRLTAKYDRSRATVETVLARARELGHAPTVARALLLAGQIEVTAKLPEAAEERLFEAFEAAEGIGEQDVAARALIYMARAVSMAHSRYKEAGRFLRQAAVKLANHSLPVETEALYELNYARWHMAHARYDEAVAPLRRALALYGDGEHNDGAVVVIRPNQLDIASVSNTLAIAHQRAGRRAEAREAFRKATDIWRVELGEQHPWAAMGWGNLANTIDDLEEALAMKRKSLAIRRASLRPGHPDIATINNNIGVALVDLGRYAEGLEHYHEAVRIYSSESGDDTTAVARARSNISEALRLSGDLQGALREAEAALAITQKRLGPEHPRNQEALTSLGWAQLELGHAEQATATFERAIEVVERDLGREHPTLVAPLTGLGGSLLASRRRPRSAEALRRAVDLATRVGHDELELATARFFLARATWDDDAARARRLATGSRSTFARLGSRPKTLARIETWIATHPPP